MMAHLWSLGLTTVLAVLLLRIPGFGNPESTDVSWQHLLEHDWHVAARAGVETLFTHGPLGFPFVAGALFRADDVGLRLAASIVAALATALPLALWPRRLPRSWRPAYGASVVALAAICPAGEFHFVAPVLAIQSLFALTTTNASQSWPERYARWLVLALASLWFAINALAKSTYGLQSAAHVAAIAAILLWLRRPAAAVAAVLLPTAMLLAVWCAAGQRLRDVPAFLHGSFEMARGYNEIMGLPGDTGALLWGIAMFAAIIALGVATVRARPDPLGVGTVVIVLTATLVTWKAGFVRQDTGHVALFVGCVAMAPFLLAAAGNGTSPFRRAGAIAAALTVALALGQGLRCWHELGFSAAQLPTSLRQRLEFLSPARLRAAIAPVLQQIEPVFALPSIRARIGQAPVDLMGQEQGVLFAAGLTVRHRPVFQGYSAYTPYLQQLNGAFFAGAAAPQFVLAKVQAFDRRLPLADDSQAWRALLDGYAPVLVERGYLLLERTAAAAPPPTPWLARTLAVGEWLELPPDDDRWHELSLEIAPTWAYRAEGLLLRPGDLWLELRCATGPTVHEQSFRIAPSLVRSPFAVDPLLLDTADLASACLDLRRTRVRALRVRADGASNWRLQPRVGVTLGARRPMATATNLPAGDRQGLVALAAARCFPSFALPPVDVAPAEAFRWQGTGDASGFTARGSASLRFRWPGDRHRLRADFALVDTADGDAAVTLEIEVEQAGGAAVAFTRTFVPKADTDRGLQDLQVELDAATGALVGLHVRTDGAAGWTIARVRLDPP